MLLQFRYRFFNTSADMQWYIFLGVCVAVHVLVAKYKSYLHCLFWQISETAAVYSSQHFPLMTHHLCLNLSGFHVMVATTLMGVQHLYLFYFTSYIHWLDIVYIITIKSHLLFCFLLTGRRNWTVGDQFMVSVNSFLVYVSSICKNLVLFRGFFFFFPVHEIFQTTCQYYIII